MKVLVVGGAVRDMLLGRKVKDIDYLVQGATEAEFLELYPNAERVGKHFPVFLVDGEEYAFARTEESVGDGHKDFRVTSNSAISIVEDLQRRDITINAIAMCPETGMTISPPESISDLRKRFIRHMGSAFEEDPLRVFRVARFAAELYELGFSVHPETLEAMYSMRNKLDSLPSERVFCEMRKALASSQPSEFFRVLRDVDCLDFWFFELANLIDVPAGPDTGKHAGEKDTFDHTMISLDRAPTTDPILRYAVLCHDLGKGVSPLPPKHHGHDKDGVILVESLSDFLRVPKIWKKTAMFYCKQHLRLHKLPQMRPGKVVTLVEQVDRHMYRGMEGAMRCSIGDGEDFFVAFNIIKASHVILDVKLAPEEQGRGETSGAILHEKRTWAYRGFKGEKSCG